MNTNQKLHLIEILSANLVLLVRRKNLQSVTKHLTINEETLRDRGHGLVPSPNINFDYLLPSPNYTALDYWDQIPYTRSLFDFW